MICGSGANNADSRVHLAFDVLHKLEVHIHRVVKPVWPDVCCSAHWPCRRLLCSTYWALPDFRKLDCFWMTAAQAHHAKQSLADWMSQAIVRLDDTIFDRIRYVCCFCLVSCFDTSGIESRGRPALVSVHEAFFRHGRVSRVGVVGVLALPCRVCFSATASAARLASQTLPSRSHQRWCKALTFVHCLADAVTQHSWRCEAQLGCVARRVSNWDHRRCWWESRNNGWLHPGIAVVR